MPEWAKGLKEATAARQTRTPAPAVPTPAESALAARGGQPAQAGAARSTQPDAMAYVANNYSSKAAGTNAEANAAGIPAPQRPSFGVQMSGSGVSSEGDKVRENADQLAMGRLAAQSSSALTAPAGPAVAAQDQSQGGRRAGDRTVVLNTTNYYAMNSEVYSVLVRNGVAVEGSVDKPESQEERAQARTNVAVTRQASPDTNMIVFYSEEPLARQIVSQIQQIRGDLAAPPLVEEVSEPAAQPDPRGSAATAGPWLKSRRSMNWRSGPAPAWVRGVASLQAPAAMASPASPLTSAASRPARRSPQRARRSPVARRRLAQRRACRPSSQPRRHLARWLRGGEALRSAGA